MTDEEKQQQREKLADVLAIAIAHDLAVPQVLIETFTDREGKTLDRWSVFLTVGNSEDYIAWSNALDREIGGIYTVPGADDAIDVVTHERQINSGDQFWSLTWHEIIESCRIVH